jgi:hypothetical protein
MGGFVSKDKTATLDKSEEEVVKLMMPVYYNELLITDEEYALAHACWGLILNDTSPEFLERRRSTSFTHQTCIMFFYNVFYARLFDIHPLAKDLFKDVQSQGKFLVKMISLSLSEKNDSAQFKKTLQKLAEVHNERGVKATECKHAILYDKLIDDL